MTRNGIGRLAAAFLPFLLWSQGSVATAPPRISKVKFVASGGTFNATISGLQFGTAPSGVPCTACSIPEFSITAIAHLADAVSYNITAWTNTSITVTGINAAASDAVSIALKNDALKNVATWGGTLPGKVKNPKITKITFSGSGATLHITIAGTGFGSAPAGIPGTTDVPYLNFVEWNVKAPGPYNYPWGAGWDAQGYKDTATLKYTSWTSTQIVISGFGGAYGTDGFTSKAGDPYVIWLWQTPGSDPGSTGPQTAYGGRVP
jgi:hypothetical protein